jgi:hypothetical protein
MPTNLRYRFRRRTARVADLDVWSKFMLTHGDARQLRYAFGPDWQEIVPEAWACHGSALVAEWVALRPGSRPPLWWVWDAPGERPVINPAPAAVEAVWREQYMLFGRVVASILHGYGTPGRLVPWLEPEWSFLERHGLLTDVERRPLPRRVAAGSENGHE